MMDQKESEDIATLKRCKMNFSEENVLPFDQYTLIALAAPRPVFISSATEDVNADSRGEFLATYAAREVYRLYDENGLPNDTMPPLDTTVASRCIAYHIRTGSHAVTHWNWMQYIDFAKRYFAIPEE